MAKKKKVAKKTTTKKKVAGSVAKKAAKPAGKAAGKAGGKMAEKVVATKKGAAKPAKKVAPKTPSKQAVAKPAPKKKAGPSTQAKKVVKKVAPAKVKEVTPKTGKKATGVEPAVKVKPKSKPKLAPESAEPAVKARKGPAVQGSESDESVVAEIAEVAEVRAEKEAPEEDVIITDAEGRRYCRVRDCDQIAVVDVYCRYHYLAMWKRIQQRRMILSEGKLEKYIEELTSRYGDKYLEIIRKDLRTAKDFLAAIHELEIDENLSEGDFEEDEARTFIEEMRGVNDNKQEDDY